MKKNKSNDTFKHFPLITDLLSSGIEFSDILEIGIPKETIDLYVRVMRLDMAAVAASSLLEAVAYGIASDIATVDSGEKFILYGGETHLISYTHKNRVISTVEVYTLDDNTDVEMYVPTKLPVDELTSLVTTILNKHNL
jgi:hypothetical protein